MKATTGGCESSDEADEGEQADHRVAQLDPLAPVGDEGDSPLLARRLARETKVVRVSALDALQLAFKRQFLGCRLAHHSSPVFIPSASPIRTSTIIAAAIAAFSSVSISLSSTSGRCLHQ
jgi:hypothetical protein